MKEDFDTISHVSQLFKILEKNKIDPKKLLTNTKVLTKLLESYCEKSGQGEHITEIKRDFLAKIK